MRRVRRREVREIALVALGVGLKAKAEAEVAREVTVRVAEAVDEAVALWSRVLVAVAAEVAGVAGEEAGARILKAVAEAQEAREVVAEARRYLAGR